MGKVASSRGNRPVRLVPAAALLALLGGCASLGGGGGGGGGWAVARDWGCDAEKVRQEHQSTLSNRPDVVAQVPIAGWTACQLLERKGPPAQVELTPAGTYLVYYGTGEETHLVTMRREFGAWVVSAVVW